MYLTLIIDCDKMYDVESGEIINSGSSRSNIERSLCTYSIIVPKGRRITAEVIEGKSIVRSCDILDQGDFQSKEKLLVSVIVSQIIIKPIYS